VRRPAQSRDIGRADIVTAMSPVSRGRKKKLKQGKPAKFRPRRNTFPSPFADAHRPRPGWFAPSTKNVFDRAEIVLSAGSSRELEQKVSELLGAELYHAVHDERGSLHFEWWFHELVDAAAATVRRGETVDRLLRGMAAIGAPALRAYAEQRLPHRALADLPHIKPTGEMWHMRDAYGTRFAVIAGFSYPGVFLFDIDAGGFVTLAGADVHDDVEQAAAAWRDRAGDSATGAKPRPVGDPDEVICLADLDVHNIMGDESRNVLDNWFRVDRRLHDLADAGLLPHRPNLYHEIDAGPMIDEFTHWYSTRHHTAPDTGTVEAIALEWIEGKIPDTWHSVSPGRVTHVRALMSDWDPEYLPPAEAMLPDWVRWLVERTGLPQRLAQPVFAALQAPLES
jgi:hypothetical protein